jgi:hypothetical protein
MDNSSLIVYTEKITAGTLSPQADYWNGLGFESGNGH